MTDSKAEVGPEQITFKEDGCCKTRTKLEKCLIFFVILLFLIAVAAIAVALYLHFDDKKDKEEVCTSPECLETAAFISKSMDTTVNPCDDFYQFACGRWMKDNPIPPSLPSINHFTLLQLDVWGTVRNLLSDDEPSPIDAVAKAKTYFKSCEDIGAIDEKGAGPLLDMLNKDGANLVPTLQPSWTNENLNLTQMLIKFDIAGSGLIIVQLRADADQSDKYIITITQPGYILPARQNYLEDRNSNVLMMYEQVYVDIMTSLGADVDIAKRDAKDFVDFDILVAKATEPLEDRSDAAALNNRMTVRNLTDMYPKIDWLTIIQQMFAPAGITDITMDEEVMVDALKYYNNIIPIIENASRRTLLNYFTWQSVWPAINYLDSRRRSIKTEFSQKLSGVTRSKERWLECMGSTDRFFPYAYGRLYKDKKFSDVTKARTESLVHDLIAAFKEIVHEADWMSEETKREAIEKADVIGYKIGYPDFMVNDTALNEKTEKFNITSDYFHNTIEVAQRKNHETLKRLRIPVDKKKWPYTVPTVGAAYEWTSNSMVLPAGILQVPFFSDDYPEMYFGGFSALNYGGIGFVIGHELTHGFDSSGASYDKYGNLKSWWQPDDWKNFGERLQCMVQQYGTYKDPVWNINVNGRLTIGENVADNGGLKEAFRAYRKLINKRGKEELKLSTLDYTPDQLFFISAAQVWCENKGREARKTGLLTDVHSPNRWRVIGPLQNSANFSLAFNCPAGSYMNPAKKCHVW